jgi:PPOX class probable F420-dependent enzyme
MTDTIPDSHTDLLTEPVTVAFTTLMPDGMPQVTPVWVDYDGTHILVNAGIGRQKDRNVRRDARVNILAMDPTNPYRYLEVRGVVAEITEDGAEESMNALSLKYRGIPKRYGDGAPPREVERRVVYKIRPLKVVAHG